MKTMKSKIFILITLALLFTVSCEKFLEETTYSQITPELLFTSAANAELAINGIYSDYFHDFGDMRGFWPATWGTIGQEFSSYQESAAYDFGWNSGHTQIYWMWRGLYRSIKSCNTAIDGVTNMEVGENMSEAQKSQLLGEARFLRAHGYYYLFRLFGGVPLQELPTENPEAAVLPRSSAQAILDFAVADLKFAQNNLPVNYNGGFPDNARATKGAATATLAQMYMQASGKQFEGNDAVGGDANFNNITTKYWNEAKAELASMIDESNPSVSKAPYMYALEPDLAELYTGGIQVGTAWLPANNQAKDLGQEIIWCANYEPSIYQGTWQMNHWGGRYLSQYNRDRYALDGYRASVKHDSAHKLADGYIVPKHIKRNWTGNNNENNVYWARYAGMLLLMAECENEIANGPTPLGEACLNAVRERARNGDGSMAYTVPADVATGLSYDAFKREVWNERIVEFFLEFKFYHDAFRMGYMEEDYADITSGADGNRGSWDKSWNFMPIPNREIIVSGGLLVQNPGH
jgi:hypothetical protein